MANGALVSSKGTWKGEVTIAGVNMQGEFEVFDSRGGWKFLLGKPMLQSFKAIHKYETDMVHITGNGISMTITNQNQTKTAEAKATKEDAQEMMTTQDTSTEPLDKNNGEERDIVPTNLLNNDAEAFTRITDPKNPRRVTYIVKSVQIGDDLSLEEQEKVKELISQYADIFACSLSEVLPVPGAEHQLNIPQDATFHTRVHQKALTPPQTKFLHSKIDEMLTAGIIEKAPADTVKCCATTVLAQKAHEQGGLTLEELQHQVNEQCAQHGEGTKSDCGVRNQSLDVRSTTLLVRQYVGSRCA
jgi:hypothetical protein